MTRFTYCLAIGAALAPMLCAAPARAVAPGRVWVSSFGSDSSSCGGRTTPCATFLQAQANVAAGGEISVLTPGDFGPLTINQSLSITNDGSGEAGIQVTSGNAIFISAGAGDIVGLRGLIVDGAGTGGFGITFLLGSALHVQNCVIRNFEGQATSTGLVFSPSGTSQLFVSDTIIYNNGQGANSGGILVQPTTGSANVALDRVQLENNVFGLKVDGSIANAKGSRVIVRDSVFSGNAGDGLVALGAANAQGALVFVIDSAFVGNTGNGILANGAHGTVLLTDSVVTRNGAGINAVNSGQIISYQNNKIDGNVGSDGNPTSTRTQH